MTTDLGFDGGLTCAMESSDINRSIAWYRDVLGFSLLYKVDEMGWCELKSPVPGVNVGLSQVESPTVKNLPSCHTRTAAALMISMKLFCGTWRLWPARTCSSVTEPNARDGAITLARCTPQR